MVYVASMVSIQEQASLLTVSTEGSPAPVVNATGEAPPETAAHDVTSYRADLQKTLYGEKLTLLTGFIQSFNGLSY